MILSKLFQKMLKSVLLVSMVLGLLVAAGVPTLAAAQTISAFERLDHPVYLIAAYYNAIARQDYARAYSYWYDGPPNGASYAAFAQGFADVQSVHALARLPVIVGVAAGTAHAEVPVNVLTTHHDGSTQIYAGCFHVVQHNVPVGEAGIIDPNWYLSSASLHAVTAVDFVRAADACTTEISSFPNAFAINNQDTPPDLLTSYYDAIARHDYIRAYQYWPESGKPGQTLAQFIRGFANTEDIGVVVALSFDVRNVPGDPYLSYVDLPVLLTSTDADQPQLYVGCFTTLKSIALTGDTYDPGWSLSSASLRSASTLESGVQQIWSACSG